MIKNKLEQNQMRQREQFELKEKRAIWTNKAKTKMGGPMQTFPALPYYYLLKKNRWTPIHTPPTRLQWGLVNCLREILII